MLILLQACSGGSIGNFLETSFKNNNLNQEIQKEKSLKNKKISPEKSFVEKKQNSIKKDISVRNYLVDSNKESILENNVTKIIPKKNNIFNPKSYRIFVILKKVDPSSPTEKFSKVLRDASIDFEIEKIELIKELNKYQKINEKNF
tara:strand:- start:6484 stop:6921 length:438 start_codon:yes stop_codon:yes gene_type:complete